MDNKYGFYEKLCIECKAAKTWDTNGEVETHHTLQYDSLVIGQKSKCYKEFNGVNTISKGPYVPPDLTDT
jgi:hypothetical protein